MQQGGAGEFVAMNRAFEGAERVAVGAGCGEGEFVALNGACELELVEIAAEFVAVGLQSDAGVDSVAEQFSRRIPSLRRCRRRTWSRRRGKDASILFIASKTKMGRKSSVCPFWLLATILVVDSF